MKLFVLCTRDGQDCYMMWEGLTQDQVMKKLDSLGAINSQLIDEATYAKATMARLEAKAG